MPPPPSFEPVATGVVMLWLAAAGLAVSASAALTVVLSARGDRSRRRGSRRHRDAAVTQFASAVIDGDLVRAEAAARRAFDGADDQGRGPVRVSWDEFVDVDCPLAELVARLRGPRDVAQWFARLQRAERPTGARVIVAGFPLLVAEQWTGNGMTFRAEAADGSTFDGYLTIRPVLLPSRRSGGSGGSDGPGRSGHQGVEIWVHAESPASGYSRRIMPMARLATRAGLRDMAADLARSTP
jgi:hypothetical protein